MSQINTLSRLKNLRNVVMLIATVIPIMLYIASVFRSLPDAGYAFGITLFIGLAVLTAVLESVIYNLER